MGTVIFTHKIPDRPVGILYVFPHALKIQGNHVKPEHRIPVDHFHAAGEFIKGFPERPEIVRLLQKIPCIASGTDKIVDFFRGHGF